MSEAARNEAEEIRERLVAKLEAEAAAVRTEGWVARRIRQRRQKCRGLASAVACAIPWNPPGAVGLGRDLFSRMDRVKLQNFQLL